jgi:hypothetical protein
LSTRTKNYEQSHTGADQSLERSRRQGRVRGRSGYYPGDKGEFEVDQDIEEANVYSSFEDTAQDWELQQEVNELADAIDRIMGAK